LQTLLYKQSTDAKTSRYTAVKERGIASEEHVKEHIGEITLAMQSEAGLNKRASVMHPYLTEGKPYANAAMPITAPV